MSTNDFVSVVVKAMVRGYHVYKTICDADIGEELHCQRETGNPRDPFAVAVIRASVTVGHVPKKISSICSVFLRRGGYITCRINGSRRYSEDLPQVGLEVPCLLTFHGIAKDVTKAEKLAKAVLSLNDVLESTQKRSNTSTENEITLGSSRTSKIRPLNPNEDARSPTMESSILSGEKLSDIHINYAQQHLNCQFPQLNGLQSTILQSKRVAFSSGEVMNYLQIVHSRGDHWIVASNIGCECSEVNIYDSVYNSVDLEKKEVILNSFNINSIEIKLKIVVMQKQEGSKDCGLFSIAVATAVADGKDPSKLRFKQAEMRKHLTACFKDRELKLFPTE